MATKILNDRLEYFAILDERIWAKTGKEIPTGEVLIIDHETGDWYELK